MPIVAPPPTVRTVVDNRVRRSTALRRLAPALWLLAPAGCFTGLPDGEDPVPWETQTDGGDGGSDDGAAVSDGGADGATADPSTDPTADSAADPTADPTADSDGSDASGGADPTGADGTTGADGGTADPTTADGGTDDGGVPVDVPDNAFCTPVGAWQAGWAQLELDILDIMNQRRAEGANCGSEGSFGPAGPLTMQPALRCAARVHSEQMVEEDFFDHTTPWGETPWDRMAAAGYNYSTAGENIAAGNATAAATMQQWMDSDGHCANIMNADFTEIGVGYYPGGGYGHYWTQAFGRP
jgi:uncharacterized protein YkwD